MGEERRAAHRWLHLLQGGLVPLRDLLRAVGNVCVSHALRSLPVEREDLEALVIVRRLVLDVDRFDLVSVMKVRDGDGLDAGLLGRFLIVGVEVLRVEDDTAQRLGHCRGCRSDVPAQKRCVPARSARGSTSLLGDDIMTLIMTGTKKSLTAEVL